MIYALTEARVEDETVSNLREARVGDKVVTKRVASRIWLSNGSAR